MNQEERETERPLLVYDGACGFCRRWIARWMRVTGDRVVYETSQEAAPRFPEVPASAFADAVQWIEPGGRRAGGAEAVFRALATAPGKGGWLWAYERVPGVRQACDAAYRLVAGHRPFFTRVTDLLWGAHVAPPGERITSYVYLRALGVVFAIAFVSLGSQIQGLAGSHGILPAQLTLDTLRSAPNLGAGRYWIAPTVCWLVSSDWFLAALCAAGALLGLALAVGVAPLACLIGLWVAYLSAATVCREFLWFQWDGLLLEAGALACFLAPGGLGSGPRNAPAVSGAGLWINRWLLFRLLFASAAVKLLSGDPAWRDLTALRYHFETQPLPPWTAWYAHSMPLGFHKLATAATLCLEGIVPFLIFTPRRIRFLGASLIVAHQLVIAATGNYGFFNLLTIVLCILLLDDAVWPSFVTRWFRRESAPERESGPEEEPRAERPAAESPAMERAFPERARAGRIRLALVVALFVLSLVPLSQALHVPPSRLGPLARAYQLLAPLRTVNFYGLFAIMTKERPEILVEGSADGRSWKPYRFRYKPGDPEKRPDFVPFHMPRLDWQMWFAALSDFQREFWFWRFCDALLRNSPPVLELMATNPFPGTPPRYVRAVVYRYHFTDSRTRRATGSWWRREPLGLYAPVLMIEGGKLSTAPPELQRW